MSQLKKRLAFWAVLTLFAALLLVNIQPVKAQSQLNIHINPDGSIRGIEGTNDILQQGNIYTLKNDVKGSIVIEKDGVIIDGAGFKLIGDGSGSGIKTALKTDRIGYGGNEVKNLKIIGFANGIALSGEDNIVRNCEVINCNYGISISSTRNTINGNTIANSNFGIHFLYADANVLTNNRLDNNTQPLWFEGYWTNTIAASNLIDGKPVYFFVNQKDVEVNPSSHPSIGYLAFVDCQHVTVKNLNRQNAAMGIILVNTPDSEITQNTLENNFRGIYLYGSYNNNVSQNQIRNCKTGLQIVTETVNIITGNTFENNECGIFLEGSAQIMYHNNFINNQKHVDAQEFTSLPKYGNPENGKYVWDNGYPSGGNYWSDYTGKDENNDGIGDTPYIVSQYYNNTDYYPLMQAVSIPEFQWAIVPLLFIITTAIAVGYRRKKNRLL
jgi:parallel beta-helix repeat protein